MTALLSAWFVVVGVSFIVVMLRAQRGARSESSWRQVPGVILTSNAESAYEGYLPHIRFDYTFEGSKYVGGQFKSAILTYNWRGPSERVVGRYPPGTRVTVYVNPSNPKDAVLEPSVSGVIYHVGVAAGCLFALLGVVGLIHVLTK
jgi:hypothetical protein